MKLFHIAVMMVFVASWCRAGEGDSWITNNVSISTLLGFSRSHLESDGDLHYYFEPLGDVKNRTGYDWGVEADFKMARFFYVCTGMRYEAGRGQYTEMAEVVFDGNPAIHEFESFTRLTLFTIPLNVKLGYDYRNHWLFARLGPVASRIVSSETAWRVDNEDADGSVVAGMPNVDIHTWDDGLLMSFLFGLEYGYTLGENGLFVSAEYQRGLDSFAESDVSGEVFIRNWSYMIGFRKFF